MTTASALPVTVEATEYTVSLLPADHPDCELYAVTVEWRGSGRWAVCRFRRCLDANLAWDWESIPGEREDEWLATHRFDLDTALALARRVAPGVTTNGRTAHQAAEEARESQ